MPVARAELAPAESGPPPMVHLQETVTGTFTVQRWTWAPGMHDIFRAYARLLNIRRRYRKVSWRRLDRAQQWAAFVAFVNGEIQPRGGRMWG